jgi:hypothetical protein
MGQRQRILSQIVSYQGWRVRDFHWEDAQGQRIVPIAGYFVPPEAILILVMVRRWSCRCGQCGAIGRGKLHENRKSRRWVDLDWAGHKVFLEYRPQRFKCARCGSNATELLPWATTKKGTLPAGNN